MHPATSLAFYLQDTYYNPYGPLSSTLSDYPFVQVSMHLGNFHIYKTKVSFYSTISKVPLKETGTENPTKLKQEGNFSLALVTLGKVQKIKYFRENSASELSEFSLYLNFLYITILTAR